jgi:hypothetical protein
MLRDRALSVNRFSRANANSATAKAWSFYGSSRAKSNVVRLRPTVGPVSEDGRAASMIVALDELLVDAKLSVPSARVRVAKPRGRGAQHEPGNARRCVGRRAQPALGGANVVPRRRAFCTVRYASHWFTWPTPPRAGDEFSTRHPSNLVPSK